MGWIAEQDGLNIHIKANSTQVRELMVHPVERERKKDVSGRHFDDDHGGRKDGVVVVRK